MLSAAQAAKAYKMFHQAQSGLSWYLLSLSRIDETTQKAQARLKVAAG